MRVFKNACLDCGACCAFFRASFYYAEADDVTAGGVPLELTEDLNDIYRCMKGTNAPQPYCIALEGEIGKKVACSIHPRRANVCRDFDASYFDGKTSNERCDKARAAFGLRPLRPGDWVEGDDHPDRPPDVDPRLPCAA